MAAMLRRHFGFVESFAWEGPDININKVACDIIRELVTDAAFDILTGGDKPNVEVDFPVRWPGRSRPGKL